MDGGVGSLETRGDAPGNRNRARLADAKLDVARVSASAALAGVATGPSTYTE